MAGRKTKKFTYRWEGKDASGAKRSGEIESTSLITAKVQLRKQGIIPLKILKQTQPLFSFGEKKITTSDIAIFARQLTTMMKAGVPMVQSFEIVAGGMSNKSMRELVLALKTDVEAGNSLATAMRKHPNHFDDLFCNLVSAGEQSGALESLLNEITTYKEKTEALKAKIKKALSYPLGVTVIAFAVTTILLIYVVPQFESLFENVGSDLPVFTQYVVNLSEFLQAQWYIILGTVLGSVYAFIHFKKTSKKFSVIVDGVSLKLPVVGDLLSKAATARFARTLSTMTAAGVPYVEAMESVAGTAGNALFYDAILSVRDEIATGQRLQPSLRQTGLFSNMVVQMVGVGEESGSLDKMLSKVADYYEEEVDNGVDSLTSLMQPMLMAFLGIVVGGLVIAMYLPIFKLSESY